MDHSLPVSPVRGISQARLLEWIGFPFPSPEDLPDSWIEPACTVLPGRFFTTEPPGKPIVYTYHILFYHLFIHGYIYLLTVMNSAAVNMVYKYLIETLFSVHLDIYLEVKLLNIW